jgi:hypothetical protein
MLDRFEQFHFCFLTCFFILVKVGDRFAIKSGCDFKELSLIELCIGPDNQSFVKKIEKCVVDSSLKENEKIKGLVDMYFGIQNS